MQVVKSLKEVSQLVGESSNLGITIGNFDGVHQGHTSVISYIKKQCHDRGLKFALVTFNPHPRVILDPSAKGFLLSSSRKKENLISQLGVDYYIELPFTRDFSTLTPYEFLDQYVLNCSHVKCFYMGHDFAFGADKSGTYEMVQDYCNQRDVNVELLDKFVSEGERVSSSLIRNYLKNGLIEKANQCLSRSYSLSGIVVKGEGRGKKIGFPTANMKFADQFLIPSKGVYVTQTLIKGMRYNSVTNIGNNPTFANDPSKINVETHILDFDDDIYGEEIEVFFHQNIRSEKKFSTVNELIDQIKEDVHYSRKYFQT
jgi:riboflavin kinase/FMN adenylyltransferase